MLRYRVYFSATHPYYFGDRLVSIPNHAIHLVPLATLTDLGYQKRAMPASLVFFTTTLPSHSILWTCTNPFRTFDDDVVVTFVSRYLIVKSVLTCVSIQIQPLFSQCLV